MHKWPETHLALIFLEDDGCVFFRHQGAAAAALIEMGSDDSQLSEVSTVGSDADVPEHPAVKVSGSVLTESSLLIGVPPCMTS